MHQGGGPHGQRRAKVVAAGGKVLGEPMVIPGVGLCLSFVDSAR